MAATLTQLRARLILPTGGPEAQAAMQAAECLRRELLNRRHIQAAADWLERRQQLGLQVWARGRSEQGVAGAPGEGGDLAELMRACLVTLALPDQLAEAYRLPPRTLWPVPASIARIRERLAVLPDGSALTALLPDLKAERVSSFLKRSALASTFVVGLELARDGQLMLYQEKPWLSVHIRPTVALHASAPLVPPKPFQCLMTTRSRPKGNPLAVEGTVLAPHPAGLTLH